MKTNRKSNNLAIELELRNLFEGMYNDDASVEEAVNQAIRAYSYIKHDVLYRKSNTI